MKSRAWVALPASLGWACASVAAAAAPATPTVEQLIARQLSARAAPAQTPPPALEALHWRLLGPFRAGWATMVEGVPSRPDSFYFGAAGGGVWRTENAGRTWAPLFEHGPASSVGALAVARSDPNTLYIGTGQPEPRYDVAGGQGVYKSVDGGASWTALGLAATRYIGKIWIDPKDAGTVLVGAQGHFFGPSPDRGVYRTTDGGRTWVQTLKVNDWTGVVDLAADPANSKLVFAAAWEAHQFPWQSHFTPVSGPGSGVYGSADGGASWTRITGGGWPEGPLGRISLATARTSQGLRVYAMVDSAKAGGLYRSDDGGVHWAKVNADTGPASYYASRITVAPDDPDVVYLVGQSIRRCRDGGRTCEIIRGSPGGDDYHQVWINPLHPDHMATGSDQGAVVSVDGGRTWSDWYNQPTGQFYHLAADDRFPYRIYSGQQDSGTVGIASRSDYGAIGFRDWSPVGADERDYDIPDPSDPDIVYGSGLGGRVSRWDARTGQVQNIAPWPVSSYGKRPTLVRYRYNWVSPLVASRTGVHSLYLGSQLLFRSQDQGRSWAVISPDLTGKVEGAKGCEGDVAITAAKGCGYGTIVSIAPSARHADEIWVGTDDGLIQRSRDGGSHWSDVTPSAVVPWAKVQTLELSALDDGVAYAAIDAQRLDDMQPHVLRTRDDGRTWINITANLPRGHIVSVVRADHVRAGLLYAGTDAGVFVSFDDGGRWAPLQRNLPTAWVRDLLVHGNDLIAATQGRAIWVLDDVSALREMATTPQPTTRLFTPATAIRVHTDNNKDTPPPPETALGENPPDGAVIDYEIAGRSLGPVLLEITDSRGHLVRRISSEDRAAPVSAELYFDKAWLRPETGLGSTAGLHRFVWNLRYKAPEAIKSEYTIAAVWSRGVAVAPSGPLVLPGDYTVTLTVAGRAYRARLRVLEDPRVHAAAADLETCLALSREIGAALARARRGFAEMQAVARQVDLLFSATSGATKAAAAGDLPDQARTLSSGLRASSAPGQADFESLGEVLTATEADLEAVDAAPTAAQRAVVAEQMAALSEAEKRWAAFRSDDLARLNRRLSAVGRAPVVVPPAAKLTLEPREDGQDLP